MGGEGVCAGLSKALTLPRCFLISRFSVRSRMNASRVLMVNDL